MRKDGFHEFLSDTKGELARIEPEKKCCMLAEIAGFIRVCGSVKLVGSGKMKLVLATENPAVARHYKKLIKDYFDVDAALEISEGSTLKKGRQYTLTLDDREGQKAEPILRGNGNPDDSGRNELYQRWHLRRIDSDKMLP